MRNDKIHKLRPRASRSPVEERRVGNKRDLHYSTDVRLAEHVKLGTGGGEGGHDTPWTRRILRPAGAFRGHPRAIVFTNCTT